MTKAQFLTIQVNGHNLEVHRIPGREDQFPELVFLHEGLGSVSHWKKFPAEVADATKCPVTVYSRYNDPRTGETIYRLANLKRAEPSPDLFKVPEDAGAKTSEKGAR